MSVDLPKRSVRPVTHQRVLQIEKMGQKREVRHRAPVVPVLLRAHLRVGFLRLMSSVDRTRRHAAHEPRSEVAPLFHRFRVVLDDHLKGADRIVDDLGLLDYENVHVLLVDVLGHVFLRPKLHLFRAQVFDDLVNLGHVLSGRRAQSNYSVASLE